MDEGKLPNANLDELVKSRNWVFFVIPVKTGIQYLQGVTWILDSRLRGNDDFLRSHQSCIYSGIKNRWLFTVGQTSCWQEQSRIFQVVWFQTWALAWVKRRLIPACSKKFVGGNGTDPVWYAIYCWRWSSGAGWEFPAYPKRLVRSYRRDSTKVYYGTPFKEE